MHILVTGGAGYIGSHVVQMLIEKGHSVVVFDNLVAGFRQAIHQDATFIEGDLMNPQQVAAAFDGQQYDGIMHFASHIQVGESMQKPFKYFKDNVLAMMNLLEAAAAHDVKRFILSSTANLYDDPQTMPISEDEPLIPGSVYGETKYIGERLLLWMERIYGMTYCALRYFNASGAHPNGHIGEAHNPETHLIPIVLQVALGQREQVAIYGTDYPTPDGSAVRDYIHVLDLAEAHLLALEALADGKSRQYNVGTGRGYSVKQVIETCRAVTGHPIPAENADRRAGDLPELVADSSRIMAELGWEPTYTTLEEIVSTAWAWHRDHPHGYGG